MIKQPTSNGTRQPQRVICPVESRELSNTPSSAANITATC